MASTGSRPERATGHIGTEIRPSNGVCQPRTPRLAELFADLGLCENCGTGIQRIMDAYAQSAVSPQLRASAPVFLLTCVITSLVYMSVIFALSTTFKEAIETLRYEEAFVSQTSLLKSRQHAHKSSAHPCPLNEALETARASVGEAVAEPSTQPEASERGSATDLPDLPNLPNLRDRFIASLPFTLTAGQSQVVDDIASDLERDWPMQRLLQGEVGSGKTVVALAAMLQAVGAGYQAVLVAPTQVLAEQHYETISKMVSGLTLAQPGAKETDAAADVEGAMGASGASTVSSSKVTAEIPVTLLTGGMKLAARRKALAAAASGEPGIIVATHAAFSKTFQAPHLALVVIDEQHRFGVEQRESLNAKTDDGTTPHLLVMTATPIPRTAAMTWFGDLDISWLTELPGGRKPIRTVVVNEADAAMPLRFSLPPRCREL